MHYTTCSALRHNALLYMVLMHGNGLQSRAFWDFCAHALKSRNALPNEAFPSTQRVVDFIL